MRFQLTQIIGKVSDVIIASAIIVRIVNGDTIYLVIGEDLTAVNFTDIPIVQEN